MKLSKKIRELKADLIAKSRETEHFKQENERLK